MAWPVRRVFRAIWWITCVLTLVALPVTVWEFKEQGYSTRYNGWFVAGIFVIMSIPISLYQIVLHTEYYTKPKLQRYIIRILWMVPLYGVDAWFALRFKEARMYLDPLRECYQAFVIYSFFAFLVAYLEDTVGNVGDYLAKKPQVPHLRPARYCVPSWPMGPVFLARCKRGVLYYVILRPICTAVEIATEATGNFDYGVVSFKNAYIYVAVTVLTSQLIAMYCLAMLYFACRQELRPIRPVSKFLCIKAVVFFTLWQSVAISIAQKLGWLGNEEWTTYETKDVASGLQDFLVCVEMFIAAICFAISFPAREYMDQTNAPPANKGFFYNVWHMFDLRDVAYDLTGEIKGLSDKLLSSTPQGTPVPDDDESHELLACDGQKRALSSSQSPPPLTPLQSAPAPAHQRS